ncbi:MAG: hypothetical protein L3J39_09895 [Verrucomicrobiales bacterium]|nr:hypothetical protein [Verrucomicrobiales bacterium]
MKTIFFWVSCGARMNLFIKKSCLFLGLIFSVGSALGDEERGVSKTAPILELEQLIVLLEKNEWNRLELLWQHSGGDYYMEGPEIVIVKNKNKGQWEMLFRDQVRYQNGKEVGDNWEKTELNESQVKSFTKQLEEYMIKAKEEISFSESIEKLSESERRVAIKKANLGFGIAWMGYVLELSQGGQKVIVSDRFSESAFMMGWMNSFASRKSKKE